MLNEDVIKISEMVVFLLALAKLAVEGFTNRAKQLFFKMKCVICSEQTTTKIFDAIKSKCMS